jgi:hypothetical protein
MKADVRPTLDTYDLHIGANRAIIDRYGLSNLIGSVAEAIEQELEQSRSDFDELEPKSDDAFDDTTLCKNYQYAIDVLNKVNHACDIAYERDGIETRKAKIDELISSLIDINAGMR